jgi:hypothetical protein
VSRFLVPLALLVPPACYQSSAAPGDVDGAHGEAASVEDAAPPDAGDAPEAVDTEPPADGPPCATDDDCVVALWKERCCRPDPRVVSRAELAADPCLFELGTAWAREPTCAVECYACTGVTTRVYDAVCRSGRCVPVTDFCAPLPEPAPVAELEAQEVRASPELLEPYFGRPVALHGRWFEGPDSCRCCPDCLCTCFERSVRPTLDCAVSLAGSTCGVPWICDGTECTAACSPVAAGSAFRVDAVGFLVPVEATGPELWVFDYAIHTTEG